MISNEAKAKLIKAFGKSANDVGSSEVQIAILSERIRQISAHLKQAHKDYSSQRGLMKLVGRKRSLIRYLQKNDQVSHAKVLQSLKEFGY